MPELQASAHGSAAALTGKAPDLHAVSLANGDNPEPCVVFAASAHGELTEFGVRPGLERYTAEACGVAWRVDVVAVRREARITSSMGVIRKLGSSRASFSPLRV